MLKAVLFDFDGVIADTEPLHLQMFQQVLAAEGLTLTAKDYYQKYLGYDDRSCFQAVYRDRRRKLSVNKLAQLLRHKTRALQAELRRQDVLLPGLRRVVKMLAARYPLAIVSGALGPEIRLILRRTQLSQFFPVIVAAGEVRRGKPAPDGFRLAVRKLNQKIFATGKLRPAECLAIEDSHWGIRAAQRAGLKCLAVATSYRPAELRAADWVLPQLRDLTLARLRRIARQY